MLLGALSGNSKQSFRRFEELLALAWNEIASTPNSRTRKVLMLAGRVKMIDFGAKGKCVSNQTKSR